MNTWRLPMTILGDLLSYNEAPSCRLPPPVEFLGSTLLARLETDRGVRAWVVVTLII